MAHMACRSCPASTRITAGGIQAQGVETVAVRAAVVGEPFFRETTSRTGPALWHAAQQGRQEAEGGRQVAGGLGCHLMQRTEGKAALGQVGIENGQPEGEGTPIRRAQAFHLRDLAPQKRLRPPARSWCRLRGTSVGRLDNGEEQCRTKIEQYKN